MRSGRAFTLLDFDGITLRGATVRVDGDVRFGARSESTAANPEAALAEVIHALERPPRRCVVRTTEAVAGRIDLPVRATRRRASDELTELLRWEIEPLQAQQSTVPPIGEILVARGDLDPPRVEQVLAELAARRGQGGPGGGLVRFGGVARDLGYVTESRLEEALAIQERCGRRDDGFACGWRNPAAAGSDADESTWLVAGIAASRRRWWRDQLRVHGCRLDALYPRLPSAVAAVPGDVDRAVLEVEPHAVAFAAIHDGALASLQVLARTPGESAVPTCLELLDAAGTRELLVGGAAADRALVEALGPRATLMQAPAEAGLRGVARHAAGKSALVVAVPARDPAPPLRRRPAAWWTAALLTLTLAGLGLEALVSAKERAAEARHRDAREPWQKVDHDVRALRQAQIGAQAALEEIEALRGEIATRQERAARFERGIATRRAFLPELLDALAGAVTEEIQLHRVGEESPGIVRVSGSALTERSIQVFTRAVAARVTPLGLRIVDPAIRAASAEAGNPYTFSFVLEPLLPGESS